LTAARHLATTLDVLVLEREERAGGIPRHSDHTGYGLRDLRRVMTGPQYAQRVVEQARDAGAELRTSAMVTRWLGERALEVTTPNGIMRVEAPAVLLATGARERSRAARMIPGDRAAGVMTTGQLQSTVHLLHRSVGTRAVIVGSELVSWSAVLTLREAGCSTVLMTTQHDRPESYAAFTLAGRALLRVPVATRTRLTRIIGRDRVTGVEVEEMTSGIRRVVACDTVILTGDWVPDSELARAHGLSIDRAHGGPLVDSALRTSAPRAGSRLCIVALAFSAMNKARIFGRKKFISDGASVPGVTWNTIVTPSIVIS
jgi:NADPH-dependent 2,4-dienoyl-CoA reductase/sulfur reductase-like enzyme